MSLDGVFKTEEMSLAEIILSKHQGAPVTLLPFKKEILWTYKSETSISYWHGGKKLGEDVCLYNDYYGFLSSIKSALKELNQILPYYKITMESSLETRILTTIREIPVIVGSTTKDYIQISEEMGWVLDSPELLKLDLQLLDSSDLNKRLDAWDQINSFRLKSMNVYKDELVCSSKEPHSFEEIKKGLTKLKPLLKPNVLKSQLSGISG